MDTFTARLRWCLDQSGCTRALLARASGLKDVTVFRLADGTRGKEVRAQTAVDLSTALAVPFAWLFAGEGDPPTAEALRARAEALSAAHGMALRDVEPEPEAPVSEGPEVDRSEEYAQPDAEVA